MYRDKIIIIITIIILGKDMTSSTKWMNSKRSKEGIKKQTNETTPSNLKHLPLETFKTYMIPNEIEPDESDSNPTSSTSSTDTTVSDMRNMIYRTALSVVVILSNLADYIDAKETGLSIAIAESLSGKVYQKESLDVVLIKSNMQIFLNALLSCYIVYNLYFSMFLKDIEGNKMQQFSFSVGELKQTSGLAHWFLKYILCTLSMMITTLKDIIPTSVENYVNVHIDIDRRVHFILLFVIIYFILTFFGFSILRSATSNQSVGFYSVLFIAYAAFTMMSDFIPKKDGSMDMTAIKIKYRVMGTYTPVFIFIVFVVRMLGSISMISLTALVNCLYLILRAFFSLPGISLFSDIRAINTFVSQPTKDGSQKLAGDEKNSNILIRMINKCVIFVSYFMFEITFLMVFFYGISNYSSKMGESPKLQSIMLSICSIFVLIIGYIFYKRLYMFTSMAQTEENMKKVIDSDLGNSSLKKAVDGTIKKAIDSDLNNSSLKKAVDGTIKKAIGENGLEGVESLNNVKDVMLEKLKNSGKDEVEKMKNIVKDKVKNKLPPMLRGLL